MSDAKPRDRARTEAALLAAARDVLAEQGFQGFGVNAVARRAGCDKQLIYRYFGGLEGLVAAIGTGIADWLGESLGPSETAASYGELMERLILGFLAALRDNPLIQRIAAWEIADTSPLSRRLAAARAEALGRWIAEARGDLAPPAEADAPAINALLIAAVQHIVLAGAANGGFAGVTLASEADWARIKGAVRRLVRQVYREGE